jgi:hypothetical protein
MKFVREFEGNEAAAARGGGATAVEGGTWEGADEGNDEAFLRWVRCLWWGKCKWLFLIVVAGEGEGEGEKGKRQHHPLMKKENELEKRDKWWSQKDVKSMKKIVTNKRSRDLEIWREGEEGVSGQTELAHCNVCPTNISNLGGTNWKRLVVLCVKKPKKSQKSLFVCASRQQRQTAPMTLREEIAELKNELEGYTIVNSCPCWWKISLMMKREWNGTMKERYCGVWIGDSQNLLLLEEEEKEEEDKEGKGKGWGVGRKGAWKWGQFTKDSKQFSPNSRKSSDARPQKLAKFTWSGEENSSNSSIPTISPVFMTLDPTDLEHHHHSWQTPFPCYIPGAARDQIRTCQKWMSG